MNGIGLCSLGRVGTIKEAASKIIINERVNRWGERVQVRKEICR
jgi:hypothetical protein